MRNLEHYLAAILSDNIGKLILRLALGSLMLFHGYKKFMHGIDGVIHLVVKAGFPEALAYGVYLGEIVMPIMIILGFYTRISSFFYAFTMGFAIYLISYPHFFNLNAKTGALMIETPLLFMSGALALMFLGAGKFSIDKR
ncbi:DoxX family protein [Sulfurospirillum sp. 1612]|uniref:DoxX family protein n=1 Tax=Sulfurospirillum sp. 1612 TaxID=3094835 RepID=UPI002F93D6AB